MEAIKLQPMKLKKEPFFAQMENKENTKFNIGIFPSLRIIGVDHIRIFIVIRNDKSKCWTNIYHIVLDYLFKKENLIKNVEIQQHEFGVTFILFYDYNPHNFSISKVKNAVRRNLEKIFNCEVEIF